NVVAAVHHDHLFVPAGQGEAALAALARLQSSRWRRCRNHRSRTPAAAIAIVRVARCRDRSFEHPGALPRAPGVIRREHVFRERKLGVVFSCVSWRWEARRPFKGDRMAKKSAKAAKKGATSAKSAKSAKKDPARKDHAAVMQPVHP